MGILDTLKGSLFEDDGSTPAAPQKVAPAPVTAAPQAARATSTYAPGPVLNQAMVDKILSQTMARNTALTALIKAADALSDVIPDQTMRLKAAQRTAGAGRSGQDIAAAVDIHLNDVDMAERTFSSMVQKEVDTQAGGLKTQAQAAEATVSNKQAELQRAQDTIARLTQEIADAQHAASDLAAQASQKESELRQSETEFKAAAQAVRDQLNGQKQTILSTLG